MGRQLQTCPSETTTGIITRCSKNQLEADGRMERSGRSCHSCTARVIADCIAVSCCPCAVVNFFTLTLFKLPWMIGRRCLDSNKKKHKLKSGNKDRTSRKEQGENRDSGKVTAIEEESGSSKYSARFEAERVWLELYKFDHLGFGRVSFNGIQSLG
ncbi:hypothetical protein R6Q57_026659 [Mikania cordata]